MAPIYNKRDVMHKCVKTGYVTIKRICYSLKGILPFVRKCTNAHQTCARKGPESPAETVAVITAKFHLKLYKLLIQRVYYVKFHLKLDKLRNY